jgi:hypothetical protein
MSVRTCQFIVTILLLLHHNLMFSYFTVKYSSADVPHLDSIFPLKHIMSYCHWYQPNFLVPCCHCLTVIFYTLTHFPWSLFCHLNVTSLKSWHLNHCLICLFSLIFYVTGSHFSLYYSLLSHFSFIVFGLSPRCCGIIFHHLVSLRMD